MFPLNETVNKFGPINPELRRNPNIESLLESYRQVYGPNSSKAHWFLDAQPDPDNLEQNRNLFDATRFLKEKINQSVDFVVSVTGSMTASKSSLMEQLWLEYGDLVTVMQHRRDGDRGGVGKLLVQDNNGRLTNVPTVFYDDVRDVLEADVIKEGGILIMDEFNMAGEEGAHGGSPRTNETIFRLLIEQVRRSKSKLLISMLDFDFTGNPWGNTKLVVDTADINIIMAARCSTSGCRRPALFTTRMVIDEVTQLLRPDTYDSRVLVVGKSGDKYYPNCGDCHRVYSPEQLDNYRSIVALYTVGGYFRSPVEG